MKKHIYNKVYGAALLATLLLGAAACTNEIPLADNGQEPDNAKPEAGTLSTVTVSQDAGAQTRLEYSDEGTTMKVAWKEGDVIYIGTKPEHKDQGTIEKLTQAGFKKFVCETINGNQATFKAKTGEELTGISSGTQLYALYANEDNSYIRYSNGAYIYFYNFLTEQSVNETGYFNSPPTFSSQRQITNGDYTHISDYDFMYAKTEYQENQIPSFSFKHGVSLIKLILQMPSSATGKYMKKLEFKSNSNAPCSTRIDFINFIPSNATLHWNSSPVTLFLGNNETGFQCDTSTLTAYLVYGTITNGMEITVTVTDAENNRYSATLTSKMVELGKFYTAELTLQ